MTKKYENNSRDVIDNEISSLESLVSRELPLCAGIEIEFFTPKGMTRDELAQITVEKAFRNSAPDNRVYLSIESDDDSRKEDIKFVNNYLSRVHHAYIAERNGKSPSINDSITSFETERYNEIIKEIGKSFYNGDCIIVCIGAPPGEKDIYGKEASEWRFLLDIAVEPFDRSVEMVTPILKTSKDTNLFANVCKTLQTLDTEPGLFRRIQVLFSNMDKQLRFRLSGESPEKIGAIPGYQGDTMTTSGYCSVHIHHDARDLTPGWFYNEIISYYNHQDFLHDFLNPGISRANYCVPITENYITEIQEKILPLLQSRKTPQDRCIWEERADEIKRNIIDFMNELKKNPENPKRLKILEKAFEPILEDREKLKDQFIWDKISEVFLDNFKTHVEIKYQGLNQLYALTISCMLIDHIGERNLPACMKGKLGDKGLAKNTMEWRINTSTIDPKKLLLLNKLFQTFSLDAKEKAQREEFYKITPMKHSPFRMNSSLNNFCQEFGLKVKDYESMQRGSLDITFLDMMVAGIKRRVIKVDGYEPVEINSLDTIKKELGNKVNKYRKAIVFELIELVRNMPFIQR